jgi:hypothetical protein
MKIQVKSNGLELEVKKVDFDKFSANQKLAYDILDVKDAPEEPKQVVVNTVKKEEKAIKPEEK